MTERQAIERTYTDRVTVIRRVDEPDPVTHRVRQRETTVAENLPCALSVGKLGGLTFTDGHGQTTSAYTLFCAPDTPVLAGDKLLVTNAAGQLFTLWAGKPFCYAGSHAEIPAGEEER